MVYEFSSSCDGPAGCISHRGRRRAQGESVGGLRIWWIGFTIPCHRSITSEEKAMARLKPLFLCTALLLAGLPSAFADEFAVSNTAISKQEWPAAALDTTGRGFVVWENPQLGLLGRAVNSAGASGAEFRLAENVNLPSIPGEGEVLSHRQPTVTVDGNGGFVVFWTAERAFLRSTFFVETRVILDRDVFGRRFDANGQPRGEAFRVQEGGTAWESGAAAIPYAVGSAARIAVAWHNDEPTEGAGETEGVFARFFDGSGASLGPAFRVSAAAAGASARGPALAADPEGNLLVAFESNGDGDGLGVYARRFRANGAGLGSQFQVNTRTAGQQSRAAVAFREDDGYLVTWQGAIGERRRTRIFGQKLSLGGARFGTEFAVSEAVAEYDASPSVASTPQGFLVGWIQWDKSFPLRLQARALRPNGRPSGPVFQINSSPLDAQYRTGLVAKSGRVLSVWQGFLRPKSGILGTWLTP
jgi:hypothetical protein